MSSIGVIETLIWNDKWQIYYKVIQKTGFALALAWHNQFAIKSSLDLLSANYIFYLNWSELSPCMFIKFYTFILNINLPMSLLFTKEVLTYNEPSTKLQTRKYLRTGLHRFFSIPLLRLIGTWTYKYYLWSRLFSGKEYLLLEKQELEEMFGVCFIVKDKALILLRGTTNS